MRWGPPLPDQVADPAAMRALLARALADNPGNAALHAKLGYLEFDRKRFAAAAAAFEAALGVDPAMPGFRPMLARCRNHLHDHAGVVTLLAAEPGPNFERGRALMELGDHAAAEREYRALLEADAGDVRALRMLARLLRRRDDHAAIAAMCAQLASRGADNAQLFYVWGWALALTGQDEQARRLLFDPARVTRTNLPAPPCFASAEAFNAALAEEIVGNPNRLSDFALEDEANRGSARVDDLFTGARPGLITALLGEIEAAISRYRPEPLPGFDPWPAARPVAARLRPWGLIQRNQDYEEGHIHAGGWLSGVYYVRVPTGVSEDGPGCIEFGPPPAVAKARPDLSPTRRYLPREGLLLLAPSHFLHRTIPSGIDEDRISVAFDVVPDNC